MCLDNALLVAQGHGEEEITEQRLDLRMQVQLWLLKYQRGIRVSQKAHDQDREHLTNTDADVG